MAAGYLANLTFRACRPTRCPQCAQSFMPASTPKAEEEERGGRRGANGKRAPSIDSSISASLPDARRFLCASGVELSPHHAVGHSTRRRLSILVLISRLERIRSHSGVAGDAVGLIAVAPLPRHLLSHALSHTQGRPTAWPPTDAPHHVGSRARLRLQPPPRARLSLTGRAKRVDDMLCNSGVILHCPRTSRLCTTSAHTHDQFARAVGLPTANRASPRRTCVCYVWGAVATHHLSRSAPTYLLHKPRPPISRRRDSCHRRHAGRPANALGWSHCPRRPRPAPPRFQAWESS